MVYDLVLGLADRARARHWRRDTVQPADGRILEIGAGTGLNFRYHRGDALVMATEPDRAMLERAQAQRAMAPARIALIAADAETLPFRSGTFDTVVVGFAMCTIPTPGNALGEMRRVLRPHGRLRLLEHVRAENAAAAKIQDWLTPVWRRVAAGCRLDRRTVHLVAEGGIRDRQRRPGTGRVRREDLRARTVNALRAGARILAWTWLLVACDNRHDGAATRLDSAILRTGASVYEARCASCHGAQGEGAADWKRPGPDGIYPAPPHDSTGHTWHHADGLLYRIVASGMARALGDSSGQSRYGMPPFDSTLSPLEIHAVITYLKAGWTPAQRRHQAESSREDPFPATVPPRK